MDKYYGLRNMSTVQDFDLYLYITTYSKGIYLKNKSERTRLWQYTMNQNNNLIDSVIRKEGLSRACLFARQQFFKSVREDPMAVFRTYIRDIFSNSVGYSGFFENSPGDLQGT